MDTICIVKASSWTGHTIMGVFKTQLQAQYYIDNYTRDYPFSKRDLTSQIFKVIDKKGV